MELMTPVSPGELLDKLTILDIKSERIEDEGKLANVALEKKLLEKVWQDSGLETEEVIRLRAQLKTINEKLWEIEDAIRDEERARRFEDRFIELARAVYVTNDQRSLVKKAINLALGSKIVEEKSYSDYL
jgi:hypothetical protein